MTNLKNLDVFALKDLLKKYKTEHSNGLNNNSLKISQIYTELESRLENQLYI